MTTNSPQRCKFHSADWVAEHLDVSTRSVRRWIKTGKLKVHRFGKNVRISDDDLEDLIEQSRGD